MTIDENIQNMGTLIASVGLELQRFESKPSKTSATRIRASLLQIKKLADVMRKDILAESKEIPTKSRAAKVADLRSTAPHRVCDSRTPRRGWQGHEVVDPTADDLPEPLVLERQVGVYKPNTPPPSPRRGTGLRPDFRVAGEPPPTPKVRKSRAVKTAKKK